MKIVYLTLLILTFIIMVFNNSNHYIYLGIMIGWQTLYLDEKK
jgi:hypothetical protein